MRFSLSASIPSRSSKVIRRLADTATLHSFRRSPDSRWTRHPGAASLTLLGVEVHRIDSVAVPIFNPAKTVVDCFRFRRRVGFDVALEGLRSVMRSEKAKPAEIVQYARETRIWSVPRPYLEAVVADGA